MKRHTVLLCLLLVVLGLIILTYYNVRLFWPPSISSWGAIGLFFLGMGAFFLQGLRKIPADPPHKAVVTILGERTKAVKNEGWRFFPLFPYLYSYILVRVTKVNHDLPPQLVRTPDLAELEIPISLTWTPVGDELKDENNESVSGLINYLNAGGENGVKEILDDIVRERLREWAMSKIEGPQTWEEALNAREEAVSILVKSIVGDRLEPIHAEIPTAILLRFYDSQTNNFRERKVPGERDERDWPLLKKYLDSLTPEKKGKLIEETAKRKKNITCIRQGNGNQILPQLGIRLNRLNIDEIKPKGELARSAERMVTEQQEMEGDKIRIKNIIDRIDELKKLGFSSEQALEVIQTEKGKVTKQISESKWNLSQETRAMIEKIAPDLLTKILAK